MEPQMQRKKKDNRNSKYQGFFFFKDNSLFTTKKHKYIIGFIRNAKVKYMMVITQRTAGWGDDPFNIICEMA